MKEKVPFRYFYEMFRDEYQKVLVENMKDRVFEDEAEIELLRIFPIEYAVDSKEEMLEAYNKGLFNVCANYISLANSSMSVLPNDSLEFVSSILDEIEENPYQESFLTSLQFIYQNYFECMKIGCPILLSSEDDFLDSYMKITLDSNYKITQFESVNMSLFEQTKAMTKVLTMEKNKKIGPLSETKYEYRKDI